MKITREYSWDLIMDFFLYTLEKVSRKQGNLKLTNEIQDTRWERPLNPNKSISMKLDSNSDLFIALNERKQK